MSEVVNVLVAFAVIVFLFRWVTSGTDTNDQRLRSAADLLGFRPKHVTPEMVDTISSMFPNIPKDNIRYDLLRTGSIELTTNKILERSFLDAPPQAYYTLYPRETPPPTTTTTTTTTNTPANPITTASTTAKPKPQDLINRYNLAARISPSPSPSFPASDAGLDTAATAEHNSQGGAGGKAVWEDEREKREASLRERKAQMILAARQRLLEQRRKEAEAKAQAQNSVPEPTPPTGPATSNDGGEWRKVA